jgi:uncharacterized protein (TIGR03437 family)
MATNLANNPNSGEPQIAPLVANIEQAYTVFGSESSQFAAAVQIDTSLRVGLYFARAAVALASAEGASAGVQSRLRIVAIHLAQVRDLMGGAGGSTNFAVLSNATVIGAVATMSGASSAPVLAPESLGTINGDPNLSPLAMQTAAATADSAGRFPFQLAGVSVSVAGHAAALLSVSPARINFVVPAGLSAGNAEVLVTLQEGYVSRGAVSVAAVAPGIFTANGLGMGEALVMNGGDATRGGFDVWTQNNLSADKHTRLMIYSTGLRGALNTNLVNDLAGNGVNVAESVAVEARLQNGLVYQLPVEYAGAARCGAMGVDQINVVLVSWLMQAGPVELTVVVNGQRSNTATITVR